MLEHIVTRMTGEKAPELVTMVREKIFASVGKDYAWPGNVRELEQAVRRVLITQKYEGDFAGVAQDLRSQLAAGIETGSWDADAVLAGYCTLLYQRHGTFEEVARRTNLDRRTVKKYLEQRPQPIRIEA